MDDPTTRVELKRALSRALISAAEPVDVWANRHGLPYIDVLDVLDGKGCPASLDRDALSRALGPMGPLGP